MRKYAFFYCREKIIYSQNCKCTTGAERWSNYFDYPDRNLSCKKIQCRKKLPIFNTLIMVSICCYNLLLWQHIVLYSFSMPSPFSEFIATARSLIEKNSRKIIYFVIFVRIALNKICHKIVLAVCVCAAIVAMRETERKKSPTT